MTIAALAILARSDDDSDSGTLAILLAGTA
jgi:hypothetical protein